LNQINQNQNFTDHAWFDENRLIVSNDKAEIYIIQGVEVKQYIKNAYREEKNSIVAMRAFSRGFIVGSETGKFALWVKAEDSEDDITDVQEEFVILRKWGGKGNVLRIKQFSYFLYRKRIMCFFY
jgi:hypothetical protein